MNIQQIRDRYDPENDAHPVTWLEMQLAEEIERLQKIIVQLKGDIHSLQFQVDNLKDR